MKKIAIFFALFLFFSVAASAKAESDEGIAYYLETENANDGDLQSECNRLNKQTEVEVDFENDSLRNSMSKFGYEDLLADIDSMNLGRIFMCADVGGTETHRISSSMTAYYNIIKNNIQMRYRLFVSSVSAEYKYVPLENSLSAFVGVDLQTTGRCGFIAVVCRLMNLNPSAFNNYAYHTELSLRFSLMRGENGVFPSCFYRKSLTKSYLNFVLFKAGYETV